MSTYTTIRTRVLDEHTITVIQHGDRFYADVHRGTKRVKQTLYQDTAEQAVAAAERWVNR